ncbi:MAG TPA: DMT family transporter [Ktedonobacterales bacterium]|nr:DMT family transporter [Ktedonobacterales bacterium]
MASATSGKAAHSALNSRRAAFGALVLANVLWAGTYAIGKIALSEAPPIELNMLRFVLASLLLVPVLMYYRKQIPRDRRTLFLLLQLALLGFVLNKALEYIGLALSTASDVALLIATESIFTGLLSWVFLRERVTRASVAALAIGLLGVYLIVERGLVPNLGDGDTARIIGDLLVVLSLLLEAAYTVRGKSTLTTLPPLLFITLTITGSLFFWVPAGVVAVMHSGLPHLSVGGWLAVFYLAAVTTVLSYWLWFRGLNVVDASAAAPLLFIQPLLGAALAILILHDSLTLATAAGAVCIVASLLLVVRGDRRQPLVVLDESVP